MGSTRCYECDNDVSPDTTNELHACIIHLRKVAGVDKNGKGLGSHLFTILTYMYNVLLLKNQDQYLKESLVTGMSGLWL